MLDGKKFKYQSENKYNFHVMFVWFSPKTKKAISEEPKEIYFG